MTKTEFDKKEFSTGDIVEITLQTGKKRKDFLIQGHAYMTENELGLDVATILVESGENKPTQILLEGVNDVVLEARENL